jgi:hypothetical protein
MSGGSLAFPKKQIGKVNAKYYKYKDDWHLVSHFGHSFFEKWETCMVFDVRYIS